MNTKAVAISAIQFPPEEVSLRPPPSAKDKDFATFLELKADIANRGLQNLFSVREKDGQFYIIDGFRRLSALKQLDEENKLHPTLVHEGIGMVTVQVRDDNEWDALAAQLSANYHRKKTLSSLEIKAMQKIMQAQNLTLAQLSSKIGMGEAYVANLLKLQYLPAVAQAAIDSNELSLANAMLLNKLPDDMVDTYLEDALSKTVEEFTTQISAVLNEVKKNRSISKATGFVAVPKLREKKELEVALERAQQEYDMDKSDYNRGKVETLAYVFQMDEPTIAAKKAEWELKEKEKADKAEARKGERVEKKLADSQKFLEEHGKKVV